VILLADIVGSTSLVQKNETTAHTRMQSALVKGMVRHPENLGIYLEGLKPPGID
tara:strand:- start:55 stop:216 length:162 start_codon:yes stop_codon:yes gene_type:complete